MNLSRLALVALATARLTRFVTTDSLGEWLFAGPAKRWAVRDVIAPTSSSDEHKSEIEAAKRRALDEEVASDLAGLVEYGAQGPGASRRARLVSGLSCPFCVGFWIGAAVLLGEVLTGRTRLLRGVWTFALGALGLNYATGHISSRLDG